MATFSKQLESAQAAHLAVSALESAMRQKIAAIFDDWDAGKLNSNNVRHRLEGAVREAYRSAAKIANSLARTEANISGWKPGLVQNSDYLDKLITDVRRNLRNYKKTDKEGKARRRAVLRIQHSAGAASQRGYTDAILEAYIDLADNHDKVIQKVWVANFAGNIPCATCQSLNGTIIGLEEEFSIPVRSGNVYVNLQGPPRHPRCRCYIVGLIKSLDNAGEDIGDSIPAHVAKTLSTDDVKKLSENEYRMLVQALKSASAASKGQ